MINRIANNKTHITTKSMAIVKVGKERIYGLDILRAMAIIFLMFEHGKFLLPQKQFPNKYFFALKIILDGVSIFFVLSGFLVGGILIKTLENKGANIYSLFNFWINRWFRTLPNYFLVLVTLLIISVLSYPEFNISSKINYFFFTQNFNVIHPEFFPEAWSLSVEEWFYLIAPSSIFSLILLLKFSPSKSVLTICVILMILSLCIRAYRFTQFEVTGINDWDMLFRKQVLTRLDSLMFGVLGAYISHYYQSLWEKWKKPLFVSGIILLIGQKAIEVSGIAGWGFYACVFSFTSNSVGALFLLPFLCSIKTGKGLVYRAVTFISLISYSMYLLNLSLIQYSLINKFRIPFLPFVPQQLVKYVLFWAMTIFFSYLLYFFYEKKMMGLRDKFDLKK